MAFVSRGDNLLPNDTNRSADIFVKDRVTGAIERVNTDNAGGQADLQSNSGNPSISNDGRFVAFESTAANLMLGDSNGLADIFVKDRQTGEIERVSVDGNGNQAASGTRIVGSFNPSISADGRFVAFQSDAANLVPGDTNQMSDVFVHDRQTGQTVRVSADSSGNQATGTAFVTSRSSFSLSTNSRFACSRSDIFSCSLVVTSSR